MPKIDVEAIAPRTGTGYPAHYAAELAGRSKRALGDAGGLKDFGVNLTELAPGAASAQRHWHSDEDEFVYVLAGEVVLVENEGETILRAGDCAAFPKNVANGHRLVNRGLAPAIVLEVGARRADDRVEYPDIDMIARKSEGYVFTRRDGSAFST